MRNLVLLLLLLICPLSTAFGEVRQSEFTLFTWTEDGAINSQLMYTLIEGIHRDKRDEVAIKKQGEEFSLLSKKLMSLPKGSKILWHQGWWNGANPSQFTVPVGTIQDGLLCYAAKRGIEIEMAGGDI